VPKPFSAIAFVIGEPMYVDTHASEDGLERARLDLQRRLAGLEARARSLAGHDRPPISSPA
jgi:lysophospholipid acyltransferase (LPLAT)-like uncharacterized protein